jgi:hypothetical protein
VGEQAEAAIGQVEEENRKAEKAEKKRAEERLDFLARMYAANKDKRGKGKEED